MQIPKILADNRLPSALFDFKVYFKENHHQISKSQWVSQSVVSLKNNVECQIKICITLSFPGPPPLQGSNCLLVTPLFSPSPLLSQTFCWNYGFPRFCFRYLEWRKDYINPVSVKILIYLELTWWLRLAEFVRSISFLDKTEVLCSHALRRIAE